MWPRILRSLAVIPHVATLRIHTRVPCVDPGRVDAALLDVLAAVADRDDLSLWVVLHANHAREFSPRAWDALRRLHRAGHAPPGAAPDANCNAIGMPLLAATGGAR